MIAEGRASVSRDGDVLRELGPDDVFGELALILDVPRTATVTATEPLVLGRSPESRSSPRSPGTSSAGTSFVASSTRAHPSSSPSRPASVTGREREAHDRDRRGRVLRDGGGDQPPSCVAGDDRPHPADRAGRASDRRRRVLDGLREPHAERPRGPHERVRGRPGRLSCGSSALRSRRSPVARSSLAGGTASTSRRGSTRRAARPTSRCSGSRARSSRSPRAAGR